MVEYIFNHRAREAKAGRSQFEASPVYIVDSVSETEGRLNQTQIPQLYSRRWEETVVEGLRVSLSDSEELLLLSHNLRQKHIHKILQLKVKREHR